MAYSVNWDTRVVTIPKSDLHDLGNDVYKLDLEEFHQECRRLEWEFDEGLSREQIIDYIPPITYGATTLARVVLVINGYLVEFEDGVYAVELMGANTNLQDNVVVNSVSVRSNNSAGLTENYDLVEIAEAVWRYRREP